MRAQQRDTRRTLSIDYRLTGAGWSACSVRFCEERCELSASYLSDALADLVDAAAAVTAGAGSHDVVARFLEEPGEYRWVIAHESATDVRVAILEFDDFLPRRADAEGKVLLSFTCARLDFGRAVRDAAVRVRDIHGEAGYLEEWGEHGFPARELASLQRRIVEAERHGA